MDDDDLLWTRVCQGDGAAFSAVFARHGDAIFAQCARSVSRADAEDCAAIVFFEAWRIRDRARLIDGSLRPWLLTIALNVVRNQRRSARRNAAHLAALSPPEAIPDIAEAVAESARAQEHHVRIRRALGMLRPADRDVVLLCLVSDLSYSQASDALGVPIGTVRSRLSRARVTLRTHLGDRNPTADETEPTHD